MTNGPGGTTGMRRLATSVAIRREVRSWCLQPLARSVRRDGMCFATRATGTGICRCSRRFMFKERLTAQFRAEFFNVLNHPNFANPYTSISRNGVGGPADPSQPGQFGCGCVTPDVAATDPVLGSGGARDMQLGLKLIF